MKTIEVKNRQPNVAFDDTLFLENIMFIEPAGGGMYVVTITKDNDYDYFIVDQYDCDRIIEEMDL